MVARRALGTMGLGAVCSNQPELKSAIATLLDGRRPGRTPGHVHDRASVPIVSATGARRTGQSGPLAKLQEVARS